MSETTDDKFLGGRLILRQPVKGHRAGHDAILLAAATSAAPHQKIADFGAGVGAAGLALARRVGDLDLTLIEIDPALASLASHNAEVNALAARIVTADVLDMRQQVPPDAFDSVLMNPPFHDAARHRASPDEARRAAHLASQDTLPAWIDAAHRVLKSRGALTLIWRADGLSDVLAALGGKFGSIALRPVHSVADKPASRILVRAEKAGRAPLAIRKGICIDGSDEKVERALRGEGDLPLTDE